MWSCNKRENHLTVDQITGKLFRAKYAAITWSDAEPNTYLTTREIVLVTKVCAPSKGLVKFWIMRSDGSLACFLKTLDFSMYEIFELI